jgi:hypothetical protein
MCAGQGRRDRIICLSYNNYKLQEFIGPNATADDTIRRWLHWMKTDNPRSLWEPINGYRRQAEWDDHGEAYPMSKDGPDLWYWLEISQDGMYSPRMYFFNKDGHSGNNRFRDYIIEIYSTKERFEGKPFDVWKKYSQLAEHTVRFQKPLIKSRIRNFWGGVYKEFLLPKGMYYVKIRRNYSFNTIMSAVILKKVQGEMDFYEKNYIPYISQFLPPGSPYLNLPAPFPDYCESKIGRLIIDTWEKLDNTLDRKDGITRQRKMQLDLYRKSIVLANENEQMTQIYKSIKWRLNQWDTEQRKEWLDTMKAAAKSLYEQYEGYRKAIDANAI